MNGLKFAEKSKLPVKPVLRTIHMIFSGQFEPIKNMSQLMNIISNEPSLGLYRIQEHIRKSIPKLENQTKKLEDCSTVMKDLNYTMENAQHSIISGFVLKTTIFRNFTVRE